MCIRDRTQNGAKCGLGKHVGRGQIVLNLDDSPFGVNNPEIEHGIHLHRHVVVGDDVLCGYLDHLDAQIDAHHFLHEGEQKDETGAFDALELAQGEDDSPFVLAKYFYTCEQTNYHTYEYKRTAEKREREHRSCPSKSQFDRPLHIVKARK